MSKFYLPALALAVSGLLLISIPQIKGIEREQKQELLRKRLADHPFSHRPRWNPDEKYEGGKPAAPDRAWEQDFLRTMDPSIGRPAPERLIATIADINELRHTAELQTAPGSSTTPWQERGPNNVGGRTRALAYDPLDNTHKKVWAGGVTGGLWYNNDITSANSSWQAVDDFWDNIAVSCIAFDPNNDSIIYVGTGEGFTAGGGTSSRGAGIWKSSDAGQSWTQLNSTSEFYWVLDIVVRNESGNSVVYAAIDGAYHLGDFHGTNKAGIQRSTNGGSSWSNVSPNVPNNSVKLVAADLEIAADNRLWAGSTASPFSANDRGGGRVFYSDNGTSWTISDAVSVTNGRGRVEVACAPSDADVVYAVIENDRAAEAIRLTTDRGANWTSRNEPSDVDNGIPSTDFTRGQAWYDLIMAVDPNDPDIVVIGGIDLFRSTNGASSWTQISKWSNNNNLSNLNCSYVHADQHALVFEPGSSSTLLVGNDGGVFYTTNLSSAGSSDVFDARNKDYNITQFYACAIHGSSGSNIYLAGAQDNGTQRYSSSGINSTTEVNGGDGTFCFIDQDNGNYAISGYVYNTFERSTNSGQTFTTDLINSSSTGKFINPADYANTDNVLYSGKNSSSIWRVRNVTGSPSSPETVSISGMSDEASHIRASEYSSTVFVGTDVGEIFKVTNANGNHSSSEISASNMPAGAVSCIEIGANDDELLVTFFNYGVTSVWYTDDGGSNWVSKEGNLPDMPIRWALFNPNDRNEVILATELGIWTTSNISVSSPTWTASVNGMANVRVDMLQIRDADDMVIAATHGRGLFSSDAFADIPAPQPAFEASRTSICIGDTITLDDTSSSNIQLHTWTITPNTFSFVSGTDANSANPKLVFSANGSYNIKLKALNTGGTDSLTRSAYVRVGGEALPYTDDFESAETYKNWDVENPDNDYTWLIANTSGNGSGTKSAYVNNLDYQGAQNTPQRDRLISPPIDLKGYTNATLNFKHAYRRYSPSYQDSLAVYVSTDCGSNWIKLESYQETQSSSPFSFITNSDLSTAFTPSSSADWCGNSGYAACKTINLDAYTGNVVRIAFENISGWGNNLYLDDIGVTGTSNLPAPVADFSASNKTPCQFAKVNFYDSTTNSPNAWNWSFTPNTVTYLNGTSAGSQNPEVQFDAAGTYTVTLNATSPSGNDEEVKSGYVTVTAGVTPVISIVADQGVYCASTSAQFTANIQNGGNNPQYEWYHNGTVIGTNVSATVNDIQENDSVWCILTSNAICALSANVSSNVLKPAVNPLPTVGFNFNTSNSCLNDDPISLTGGTPAGGTYSGPGVSNGEFDPQAAGQGNHSLIYTYTDGNGCTNSTSKAMTVSPNPAIPSITRDQDKLICSVTASFYQWYLNGVAISGANFKEHGMQQSGTYAVEITQNGCSSKSTDLDAYLTELPQLTVLHSFRLYPNPTARELHLEFGLQSASTLNLELFDAVGKLVKGEVLELKPGTQKHQWDLDLKPGTYLLKIDDGQDVMSRSVVIR